jgi:hypothetical protein
MLPDWTALDPGMLREIMAPPRPAARVHRFFHGTNSSSQPRITSFLPPPPYCCPYPCPYCTLPSCGHSRGGGCAAQASGFSRVPVYAGASAEVVGVLRVKNLIVASRAARDKGSPVRPPAAARRRAPRALRGARAPTCGGGEGRGVST